MKKFFLFAAAAIAAMTVNAKVIDFTGLIDKTSAESAVSSFNAAYDATNLTIVGTPNSKKTAYCAELKQTEATSAWGVTTAKLKSDAQVWFDFKDNNANKSVAKFWEDYVQPNGKAMCAVISGLSAGDKVKITLKELPSSQPIIEGATAGEPQEGDVVVIELTATENEIRIYSKDEDNNKVAWKLMSVEIGGAQGVENIFEESEKAVKFIHNGQVVVKKGDRIFNLLGAEIAL